MTNEAETLPSWEVHFRETISRIHPVPGPVLTATLKLTNLILINYYIYINLKPLSKVVSSSLYRRGN